ncbi:Nse4 C-terminal-domain-containing protein [Mucidula mucida]|nr:Nse4 C-terminal-domain-containing protein [Mucidula mucida]
MSQAGSSKGGLIYDPDQDADEKRAVRKDYRSLTRNMEQHQANINDLSISDIADGIGKADKYFARVKGPQEATLDSAFLLMASNLGAQKARAMKSGAGAFDVDEFVSKLVTFMGGRKFGNQIPEEVQSDAEDDEDDPDMVLDWTIIGRKALANTHRAPAIGFMLGPLSLEAKKRAPVQRAKLEKNKAEERKPQELKEEDIARSENETTKNVAVLENLLTEIGEAVDLFKFIINPNDFAQSVENIFHLSFLIRDGKVALETSLDGEPMIYSCGQPSDEDYDNGLRKRQIVLEFDQATWKRAIEVFDITEPMVPQRPPAKTRLGNKWYG